ncbi:hypothetical protein COU20_00095, partial [Candidatus Kaiserbacteria bacterium CG10_big_fil_rev_8_21_14_0_10_59_10]
MRVLAVGPRELISGLSAFGVEVRDVTDKDGAMHAVREVRARQEETPYAIIFITEGIAATLSEGEWAALMGDNLPVVLTIPDLLSDNDAGLKKLSTLAK